MIDVVVRKGGSDEGAADWLRMYKELTDPQARDNARRAAERKRRNEERKADTGYDL